VLEINKIYCGDSIDLLKQIDSNSISLVITSPPYKKKDWYSEELMYKVFKELYRILKPNTLFFLNFGHLKENKFRPFRTCQIAIDSNFKLNDTITWAKNHYTPLVGKKNLNNLTEFIFMLYKDEMPDLDRLSIGIPYQDKSNAKRYNNGIDLKCRGNLWKINIPTITKKSQRLHKDEFPLELAMNCIKLSGVQNDKIVLDPFCGSGTVCVAAKQLGKSYIGIDISPKYVSIANERLNTI
jgi:site-specific DNA-methyltransferase (adenine-specific)